MRRIASLFLLLVTLVGTACSADGGTGAGPAGSAAPGATRPKVVVTTDILGDVTRNILGDQVNVEVLIPNSLAPANFQPAAADLNQVMGAQLVVAMGLGLEPGLQTVLADARAKGVIVLEVGTGLNPIPLGGSEANARGAGATPGSTGTTVAAAPQPDPHLWIDPDRMKQAMKVIGDAAEKLPGVDSGVVRKQIADYTAKIDTADEEIQAALLPIPDAHRRIATVHDNLGYFADRYGFTIVTVIVPATRDAQHSTVDPADVAAATTAIVDQQVYAIVADTLPQSVTDANEVAAAVAAAPKGAAPLVVALDLEALGAPGSGAETYLGLLTTNARTLAAALA